MSNKYRTTFYIGVTNNLEARIWQHINNQGSEFVKKYKLYDKAGDDLEPTLFFDLTGMK